MIFSFAFGSFAVLAPATGRRREPGDYEVCQALITEGMISALSAGMKSILAVVAGALALVSFLSAIPAFAADKEASWILTSFDNSSKSIGVGCMHPEALNWRAIEGNTPHTRLQYWNCSGQSGGPEEIMSLDIIQDGLIPAKPLVVQVTRQSILAQEPRPKDDALLAGLIFVAALKQVEPIYFSERNNMIFFGRTVFQEAYAMECKTFVSAFAGFELPIGGKRTMECTGRNLDGDRFLTLQFRDQNYR